MSRMLLLVIAGAICLPPSAEGADNRGLYFAANEYRNAVLFFEKVIQNVRGVEAVDEKLVNKFELATRDLRAAARNPRHDTRLRKEWSSIQPLQFQVEQRLFGKYTLNHEIYVAWQKVLYCQDVFWEEYAFQLDNPRHGNRVDRRRIRTRPERFVPPPPAGTGRIYNFAPNTIAR